MTEENEDPWKLLTDAARKAPPQAAPPAVPAPRASDFRKMVSAIFVRLLWCRFSLVVAIIVALAWICVVIFSRYRKQEIPLIPLPSENPAYPTQP
ncbi:hypothetical protein HZ994_07240 [Akkermansiaceae bacterium]|nr:hypothetical protein HZ994_07240 [Akkermansiaceae bacterium]